MNIVKAYTASGAIKPYSVVKASGGDVAQASAATDAIVGIASELEVEDGKVVDVVHCGITLAKAGAAIAAGDLLTSNAAGFLIPTTTADNRVIAMAINAMEEDEVDEVIVNPSII